MTTFITAPLITLCILPLVATMILAGAIRFFGGRNSDDRLVSASAGVGILWVAVLVVGIPGFPPAKGEDPLALVLLAGLLLGSLVDQFIPTSQGQSRPRDTVLDFAFAIGAVAWVRSEFDLWSLAIFVAWGTLQIRTRRHIVRTTIPATMMLLSAVGLTIVAWTGNTLSEQDLTLGVLSTTLGLCVWLSFNRSLPLGFGYLWGGFTVQLLIALRMVETNLAFAAPIAILGFIFFADTAAEGLVAWKPALKHLQGPIMIGVVSIFPIILATVISTALSQLA